MITGTTYDLVIGKLRCDVAAQHHNDVTLYYDENNVKKYVTIPHDLILTSIVKLSSSLALGALREYVCKLHVDKIKLMSQSPKRIEEGKTNFLGGLPG